MLATLALTVGALATTTTSASAADTGIVSGTIRQPGGGVVPHAEVTLTGPATVTAETRADGTFEQAVPAGDYTVEIDDACKEFDEFDGGTVSVPAGARSVVDRSFAAKAVPAPTFVCSRIDPSVSGVAKVGQPLTASPGTWVQPDVRHTYQWYGQFADPIPGATGATYVPTPDRVGTIVTVFVETRKSGFSGELDAVESSIAPGDLGVVKRPTLSGLPIQGKTLKASAGAVVPGASVSYQWRRAGRPISGATGRTYKARKADLGKRLAVDITYRSTGYSALVQRVSAPFGTKRPAKLSTRATVGKRKADLRLTVDPAASRRNKGTITISENGRTLKRVTIRGKTATVTVRSLKKGKHRLTIVYEGRKHAAGTTKTVRVKK